MRRVLLCVLGLFLLLFTFVLAHDVDNKDKADKTGKDKGTMTSGQMSEMKDHAFYTGDDVKWMDAPPGLPPGAQVAVLEGDPSKNVLFTMRAKLPGNYRIAPHWHPADEHVTVVKGTLYMGMGDNFDENTMKELPEGSFAMMTKGTRHYAMAKDEVIIQIHGQGPWGINYVNPTDDPRHQQTGAAK